MPNVDQFESVFRGADKPVYKYKPWECSQVLVVTDLEQDSAQAYAERLSHFIGGERSIKVLDAGAYEDVRGLLEVVQERNPDLLCAFRNLNGTTKKSVHSLGEYIDVLTQAAACPVMLLPRPAHFPHDQEEDDKGVELPEGAKVVMAMTDHLAGDDHLVNAAVSFTESNTNLWLLHVEDEMVFERYMKVISKIPGIDTDTARQEIRKQLLKEPRNYIESCATGIREAGLGVQVEQLVTLGHHLDEYKRMVIEHDVDLLVMNTKDEDQMAMHGLAYPLAVELRQTPMLLL